MKQITELKTTTFVWALYEMEEGEILAERIRFMGIDDDDSVVFVNPDSDGSFETPTTAHNFLAYRYTNNPPLKFMSRKTKKFVKVICDELSEIAETN